MEYGATSLAQIWGRIWGNNTELNMGVKDGVARRTDSKIKIVFFSRRHVYEFPAAPYRVIIDKLSKTHLKGQNKHLKDHVSTYFRSTLILTMIFAS